jgi:ferredoxin--NADP+ reductase
VASRLPDAFGYEGWKRIDTYERHTGRSAGRARTKLTNWNDLLAAAAEGKR